MTQVANLVVGLEVNSASFVSGAERARRAFKATADDIRSEAGRIRQAVEGMQAGMEGFASGLKGALANIVSFEALAAVARRAVTEFAEAELATKRLEGVFKATGGAAGVTVGQIGALADEFERSRLVTAETVQQSAAVLMTFKSVAGDVFTEAISLAQDMSAVFGNDMKSAAMQLGKALEDPIKGISALSEVGVTFTDVQKDLIEGFVKTGQVAAAQREILATLAGQIGGAGEAEGDSLTGAFQRATSALNNMLERMLVASGAADALRASSERMAQGWNAVLREQTVGERVVGIGRQIAGIEGKIQAEESSFFPSQVTIQNYREQIAQLRAEQEAVIEEGRQANAQAQAAAERARQTQAAAGQAAVAGIARKQAADAAKNAPAEARPAASEEKREIRELAAEQKKLADEKQRADDAAVERIKASAIAADNGRMDQANARRDATMAALEGEAGRMSPAERWRTTGDTDLAGTYEIGAGAREKFAEYADNAAQYGRMAGEAIADGMDIAADALTEFVTTGKMNIGDLAKTIEQELLSGAIRYAIQALVGYGGQALFGAPGGGPVPGPNGMVAQAHSGGTVGQIPSTRSVDMGMFAGARRYHSGGTVLGHDEVPIIAKKRERVLTEKEAAAYENGGGGGGTQVNVIDQRGAGAAQRRHGGG
jgi:hypothetical protein